MSNNSDDSDSDGDIKDDDVCFGDEKHPGTKKWRKAVRFVAKKNDEPYSPAIYKKIKKRMKDAKFYIQEDGEDEEWKEASKKEIVKICRNAYNEARARMEDVTETSRTNEESYPPSPSTPRGRKATNSPKSGSKRKPRTESPGVFAAAVPFSPGSNRNHGSGEPMMDTTYVFVATGVKTSPDTKVGISLARLPQGQGNKQHEIVLSAITDTSIFAGQGLRAGMVVTKINDIPITTVEEASNIIRHTQGTMTIETVQHANQNAIDAPVQYAGQPGHESPVSWYASQPTHEQPAQYTYDTETGQQPQPVYQSSYGKPPETETANSESNKKTRLIIILLVALIIVVIGVGVGVGLAVSTKDKDSEEDNALQVNQPGGNTGGNDNDSPSIDNNPSADAPSVGPPPTDPPTSRPINRPTNPPTNPPSGGGGSGTGGQDVIDLVPGTWAGVADDCPLQLSDGSVVDLGETVIFAWICPIDGVVGISLHGEDANGEAELSYIFRGNSAEKGDDYVFYDVSLTDVDTEEGIGDGYRFDILYGEPQGELGEHLIAFYINGDECNLLMVPTDLSEIGTLDDFC